MFLLSFCLKLNSQQFIKVGLFNSSKIDLIEIKSNEEQIFINADNTSFTLPVNSVLRIAVQMDKIYLSSESLNFGLFNKVKIEISDKSGIMLKPLSPDYKGNTYTEKLLIGTKKNYLSIINLLSIENYIVGVLRGEIGYDKPLNSYLVMAILAQTFAESYLSKHKNEGFNLCDQTHCQVFKGYFNYIPYQWAANLAKGKYILDANGNTIESLFHSNCGGKTQNSGDVWRNNLTYCKSINDSFCLNQKNSKWTKSFSIFDFCLKLNIPYDINQTPNLDFCNNIQLKNDAREKEIFIYNKKINTIYARTQLNLKSDWFDITCEGDSVLFYGKGFGHGVGLCQEGAIEMAQQGCNEEEIIHFYFDKVEIHERKNFQLNN